jgi:hypothetical protein
MRGTVFKMRGEGWEGEERIERQASGRGEEEGVSTLAAFNSVFTIV